MLQATRCSRPGAPRGGRRGNEKKRKPAQRNQSTQKHSGKSFGSRAYSAEGDPSARNGEGED